MVAFGYSLLCERRGPRELVSDAVGAEEAGFDFAVVSARDPGAVTLRITGKDCSSYTVVVR